MSNSPVRVRFAPSPTGYLHVGGARTALFNWLFAKHTGGTLVLRIEDTDKARNSEAAVQVIYDGLRWLGIDWQEGPDVGGPHGPYLQSERDDIYERHFQQLRASGLVYEEDGAWRFPFPKEKLTVHDAICGDVEFDLANHEIFPDMTIRRPDGSWIFHFVNVVDDLEMGITHVIRGEDHLSNTPKHVALYRALGAEPPLFGHIPLILNPNGSKMSKRDEGASLLSYVEGGYLPEAVRNYLCLLGWSPKDNREKMLIEEVIPLFDLEKLNRRNASFDPDKLLWIQGEYAREIDDARLRTLGRAALVEGGIALERFDDAFVNAALETCKGKFKTLRELPAYCGFYFSDSVEYPVEAAAKQFVPENRPRLEAVRVAFATAQTFDATAIETALKTTATALGVKVGVLVHPTRLACTGATSGPSLYHLIEVLGKDRVLARIDRALGLPW